MSREDKRDMRYPQFKTLACCACKSLVEVRIDTAKHARGKVFCGMPCVPTKLCTSLRPAVVKVYKTARHDNSEYAIALRKHKGLEVP